MGQLDRTRDIARKSVEASHGPNAYLAIEGRKLESFAGRELRVGFFLF
jgi:hypothetical protein